MARREDSRAGLTELAQKQGIDVAPGQLEAAGLLDASEEQKSEAPPDLPAGQGKYFRVVHVCTTIPADHDAGRPDHVVRALDRANALEKFSAEMGIIGHDGTAVKREVQEVTEADYIKAQAKRFRVDLRDHRKKDVDKKHAEHGLLTWEPPGGKQGTYKVTDKGELMPVE